MKRRDMIVIAVVLLMDLGSKFLIQSNLNLHHQIPIIENFFYITYAKNTGAAWSLFSGRVGLLSIMSFLGVGIFIYMYTKAGSSKLEKFSIALMIAGALGNLYDRLVYGYVRDFLDFIILGYDFPIFNVADSALCVGILILICITMIKKEDKNGNDIFSG